MKLSTEQAEHVANQLEGQAISEEHPTIPQLREAIGDHTFFLNAEGLHVVEPGPTNSGGAEGSALRIGSWTEGGEGALRLHQPEAPQAVTLDPGRSEDS